MSEKVAVLGCGPAGLLAAHAVAMSGDEPIIYSKKVKSPIGGAQFLHQPIPGLTTDGESDWVEFIQVGSPQGYARKVYLDDQAPTSWSEYRPGPHLVWNMRDMYAKLWDLYKGQIINVEVDFWTVVALRDEMERMVISSIPKRVVCQAPVHYRWETQQVMIEYGQNIECDADPMTIVYNGDEDDPWYRASNLFGWQGVEYPEYMESAVPDAIKIAKPLSTTFDGMHGVLYVGRYGKWKKGELVHHAYNDVIQSYAERS